MKKSILKELVARNRSFRRFHQHAGINRSTLRRLVDIARLSPSASNLQPLKYYLSCRPKLNSGIFSCLSWAGHLRDWPGPAEGERPSAYIIMLCDNTISQNPGCDHGIAAQTIMLGAAEIGLGGCMIGSVNRARLRKLLKIPRRYSILLVLALGSPREKVMLERVTRGDVRYWRDAKSVHHVPKRALNEIIMG